MAAERFGVWMEMLASEGGQLLLLFILLAAAAIGAANKVPRADEVFTAVFIAFTTRLQIKKS